MDDKEFYLDAIRDVVPEHKEEQIQDVFTISKAVLRHRRALWESCSGKACRLHRKVPATI